MRRWLKWFLWLIVSILVVLGGFYFYVFQLGGLEQYVLKEVNQALPESVNLHVSLDRISGSFFTDVKIDGH
jgi:hypothetical protein